MIPGQIINQRHHTVQQTVLHLAPKRGVAAMRGLAVVVFSLYMVHGINVHTYW